MTDRVADTTVFPLLADPGAYQPCDWNLTEDGAGRKYWVSHFIEHYHNTVEALIRREYGPTEDELAGFRTIYLAEFERLHADPAPYGQVTILTLDEIRDRHLRAVGWPDPFRHVKELENRAALKLYPRVIAELDSRDADTRLAELLEGVFAGNIFDLGAIATSRQYADKGLDFFATRQTLARRPWLADDYDALCEAWSEAAWRYRKVVFFVDNAGTDFVLGCLPLIREMAAAGRGREAEVVIAVNTGPSLNDILRDEAEEALVAAGQVDPVLQGSLDAGRIRLVESGNAAPLIDLRRVSPAVAAEARDADLLVLEGMGRSVESNRLARFTVDTARLALLKDPQVAARIDGKLFDIVCRFTPAD